MADLSRRGFLTGATATIIGITRATNTFWKSTYVHNGGATTPTRNLMLQYIAQVTKQTGEMPSLGIMGFGTWALLAQDFTSSERYNITPGSAFGADKKIESLFRALDVAGVPFYADPYCPEGTLYLINAAPVIVRAASLMPVKAIEEEIGLDVLLKTYAPGQLYAELTAITRKAFAPRLFTQIWKDAPLAVLFDIQVSCA